MSKKIENMSSLDFGNRLMNTSKKDVVKMLLKIQNFKLKNIKDFQSQGNFGNLGNPYFRFSGSFSMRILMA